MRIALALVLLTACEARNAAPPPPPSPPVAKHRAATRPPPPPALPATAVTWSAAEAAHTAEAWDAAADNYERELVWCTTDCAETAYTVVLARKNALSAAPITPPEGDAPVPVPPRVQAVVDAIDGYVAVADPSDPDLPGMKFLAGAALTKWRQPDALDRLADVLRNYRDAEVAEYAANILIDALLRADRGPEVRALVDELLADTAFLATKPELRETLDKLHALLAQN